MKNNNFHNNMLAGPVLIHYLILCLYFSFFLLSLPMFIDCPCFQLNFKQTWFNFIYKSFYCIHHFSLNFTFCLFSSIKVFCIFPFLPIFKYLDNQLASLSSLQLFPSLCNFLLSFLSHFLTFYFCFTSFPPYCPFYLILVSWSEIIMVSSSERPGIGQILH